MNTKSGFTIAEVMLALTVLVTTAFILSSIQIRSSFKVAKNREEVRRVFLIKKELYKTFLNYFEKDKPNIVNVDSPKTKIVSYKEEIQKKSSLKQFAKDVDIIWSEGTWNYSDRDYSLKMISFFPRPEEKERR
jgi:hypothetical protein